MVFSTMGPKPDLLDSGFEKITQMMASDREIAVRAYTLTLRPRLHSVPPKEIKKLIIDITKTLVANCRKKIVIEMDWEFTKNMVLHAHGTIYAKLSTIARIVAKWRREIGFVLVKEPTSLQEWIMYCKKEQSLKTTRLANVHIVEKKPLPMVSET